MKIQQELEIKSYKELIENTDNLYDLRRIDIQLRQETGLPWDEQDKLIDAMNIKLILLKRGQDFINKIIKK